MKAGLFQKWACLFLADLQILKINYLQRSTTHEKGIMYDYAISIFDGLSGK